MTTESFIKRLTDEQIKNFLDDCFPKSQANYKVHFYRSKTADSEEIIVNAEWSTGTMFDSSESFTLCDFGSRNGNPRINNWIRYLYSIFGEEYKTAYIDRTIAAAESVFR